MTIVRLTRLDEALAARPDAAALRARSSVLAMSEALTQHAAYFDAGSAPTWLSGVGSGKSADSGASRPLIPE
jgi:hypothetical protein